jgi:hypothetical protein
MERIRRLFLLLTVIGPLHMVEQMLTDIEEFYMIRGLMPKYYSWFDPGAADTATVILITTVWTACSLMFYALLHEGWPRLVVPGLFGVFGVTELHHVFEALSKAGYEAGVITCVPYAYVGALLVAAVWREWKRGRRPVTQAAALAAVS